MKKKTVSLKKLAFDKSTIASLSEQQQAKALGGATLAGDTSPCGPCPFSQDVSCNCPSQRCVTSVDIPCTGGMVTVCNIC